MPRARGTVTLAACLGAVLCACATVKSPDEAEETDARGAGDGDAQDAGANETPEGKPQEGDGDDDPEQPESPSDGDDVEQPLDEDAAVPGPDPEPDLALPFAVDDYFVTSGYMGDAMVDPSSVVMIPAKPGDDTTCGDDRPSVAARGSCHQVTYHPSSNASAPGWAGVFWQANVNDWGTLPGELVESGATRVVFSAKGKAGGEVVTFGVGGIKSGLAHQDSFDQQTVVTLTTQWKEYEVSLAGVSYSEVLGGFRWVAAKGAADVAFFVDDIRWE